MRKMVMSLVLLLLVGSLIMSTCVLADEVSDNGQTYAEEVEAQGPIQPPVRSNGNGPNPGTSITNPGNNNGVGNPLNEEPVVHGPIQRLVE